MMMDSDETSSSVVDIYISVPRLDCAMLACTYLY
jgi:hypothetical protein